MKNGLTDIICILDRSGSMAAVWQDAIGSFNTFLEDQKKHPGAARMTLTMFDHEYDIKFSCKPLNEVEALTRKTYMPGGMTALYDAVGRTINEFEERVGRMEGDEKPDKVLFVILTDGEENSSREFKQDQIKKMIADIHASKDREVVFLAAGPEAFTEATAGMGINVSNVAAYAAQSPDLHRKAVRRLSSNTSGYRESEEKTSGGIDWSATE